MMKKIKIVHILCHPPHPIIKDIHEPKEYFKETGAGNYINIEEFPYWVGFFTKDHHAVAAEELKRKTDDFDIECWRPYGSSIKSIYSKEINGIIHRVFPSFYVKMPQVGAGTFSPQLLKFLYNYIKENDVILNISVGHAWFNIWLLLKISRIKHLLPIIAIQISGGFKKTCYKELHPIKKFFKWYYLLEHLVDFKSLTYTDYYLIGSKVEFDLIKNNKKINAKFYNPGVDFSFFKPSEDKNKLRLELGLPCNKKIMIVTGNFRSSDYGYHHLIDCYAEIKRNNSDFILIIVGGYKNEDLYEKGINAGVLMLERVQKEILLKYFQASDFYGQPSLNFGFINFGGFGYAMMEALACGLPVLSQNIIHFPGTIEERYEIGLDMPTVEDLKRNMIFLKENHHKFKRTREIARKYFDVENTKLVLLDYYRQLSEQYFGK